MVPTVVQGEENAYKVIAESTTCTVTFTTETSDQTTKDDVGMFLKPLITSRGWNVSVESLDITDVVELLRAIKDGSKFTLRFDETSTTDNQTALGANFSFVGDAYINDLTLNFNDRELSAKSVQFTGCTPAETTSEIYTDVRTVDSFTEGQYVRLFLGYTTTNAVFAACKTLSFHISVSLENSTTKDTDSDWQRMEPTGISYDIQASAVVRSGETITSQVQGLGYDDLVDEWIHTEQYYMWEIAHVSGANNRTKSGSIASGRAAITQISTTAPNRANATYNITLSGRGVYTLPQ